MVQAYRDVVGVIRVVGIGGEGLEIGLLRLGPPALLGILVAESEIQHIRLAVGGNQRFDPALDLVDEVGIDSMDLATVALVIRDEYRIRIDEDDYPKLTSVRLISEYIERKLKEKAAEGAAA